MGIDKKKEYGEGWGEEKLRDNQQMILGGRVGKDNIEKRWASPLLDTPKEIRQFE